MARFTDIFPRRFLVTFELVPLVTMTLVIRGTTMQRVTSWFESTFGYIIKTIKEL